MALDDSSRGLSCACGCGAVRLLLDGDPVACVYCHCDDCQAVHGAAYLPAAIYRATQVRIVAGAPATWRRRSTTRAFCAACGTRLFAEPAGVPIRSVPAHLLPEGVFQPQLHMQCQHALVPVADALPHFKAFPPALGGTDDRVDW